MYILVITRRKRFNTILIASLSLLLLFGAFSLFRFLIPETEITLEQRVSLLIPNSTQMTSIYMVSPDLPAIQTGKLLGSKWNTQRIDQLKLSEISFQYPQALRMDEIKNLGQEISIHMNFKHTDSKMNGFFQVWKLNQPLEEFLATSKKYSSMTFQNFNQSSIQVQNMNGFLWEYVFMTTTEDIKGLEAFIGNGSEMYRFSMFVLQADDKPVYKKIFLRMVESLRVKASGVLQDSNTTAGFLLPGNFDTIFPACFRGVKCFICTG